MKIVFLGGDTFLRIFAYMLAGHEVMALYAYGNQEDCFRSGEIVQLARQHDVPVHYGKLSEADVRQYIERGCELFFSADYGRKIPVLPQEEGFYAVNLHNALLPEGRGYCPVEFAMEQGLRRSGVTMHKLADKFDAGEIILQESFEITAEDDSVDVYLKCAQTGFRMTEKLLENFTYLYGHARPQEKLLPTCKLEHYDEARLSHALSVAEARRLYRIYNCLLRVKIHDKVYFVGGFSCGKAELCTDVIDEGWGVLYRLRDGHARLQLIEAEHGDAVWQAETYPFPRMSWGGTDCRKNS